MPGFVYELVKTYDTFYKEIKTAEVESKLTDDDDNSSRKEPTNLLTLLSSLYTFKLVSPVLIYDLIKELLSSLKDLDVELLLRVLQGLLSESVAPSVANTHSLVSGQQLRQDDLLALKDIVDMMNENISSRGSEKSLR